MWSYKNLSNVSSSILAWYINVDLIGSLTTLLNLQPDDPPRALAVEVQSLFASDGVTPQMLHGLATNDPALLAVSTIVGLFNARVKGGGFQG